MMDRQGSPQLQRPHSGIHCRPPPVGARFAGLSEPGGVLASGSIVVCASIQYSLSPTLIHFNPTTDYSVRCKEKVTFVCTAPSKFTALAQLYIRCSSPRLGLDLFLLIISPPTEYRLQTTNNLQLLPPCVFSPPSPYGGSFALRIPSYAWRVPHTWPVAPGERAAHNRTVGGGG